jgi:dimeric dUTPase (all-alpha-NTP-PPase superfamily)
MKNTLVFLILVVSFGFARAQPARITLSLPKPPAGLLKSYKFFVQEVEDKRKEPGALLGRVVSSGREMPVVLPSAADRSLLSYWSSAAPEIKETYLPLYITIKDFRINEKKSGINRVAGEISLSVTFRWYRNMQPVELTNYQTAANYTRPDSDPAFEKITEQVLNQAIVHFNNWMATNKGKVPSLARNLILVFKEVKGSNQQDTVFYDPNRPLVWADFKGQNRRPGSRYAAAVFTSFAYEGRSYPKGDDLVVEIGLKVFMVKSMSWGRPESKTTSTLRHEQLHFDVTRIVVERFKLNLLNADLTMEDFDSEIQYQFLETFREMNREQEAYDGETGHGLNAGAQSAWDRKITAELTKIYSMQQ